MNAQVEVIIGNGGIGNRVIKTIEGILKRMRETKKVLFSKNCSQLIQNACTALSKRWKKKLNLQEHNEAFLIALKILLSKVKRKPIAKLDKKKYHHGLPLARQDRPIMFDKPLYATG